MCQRCRYAPRTGSPSSKPGVEGVHDPRDRVDVAAHLRDQLRRVVRVPAVCDPPGRGAIVDRLDVELVDHQRPAGGDELGQSRERPLERLDVVQGDDGDRGVEAPRRLVEVEQRRRAHVLRLRLGVDGEHVVAVPGERRGQLAVACADLQHAGGRRRERSAHEGDDVRVRRH